MKTISMSLEEYESELRAAAGKGLERGLREGWWQCVALLEHPEGGTLHYGSMTEVQRQKIDRLLAEVRAGRKALAAGV